MSTYRNPNNTETHKQCPKCERVLGRGDFPANKSKPDGLYAWCRECTSERNKNYKRKNPHKRSPVHDAKARGRARALKHEYVVLLGGKCRRCGYNEFESSFDFHHLRDKKFNVSAAIARAANSSTFDRGLIDEEVKKCILLCRNCHMALHADEWSIDELGPDEPTAIISG